MLTYFPSSNGAFKTIATSCLFFGNRLGIFLTNPSPTPSKHFKFTFPGNYLEPLFSILNLSRILALGSTLNWSSYSIYFILYS